MVIRPSYLYNEYPILLIRSPAGYVHYVGSSCFRCTLYVSCIESHSILYVIPCIYIYIYIYIYMYMYTLIARFVGPTWGPHLGPLWAPWTLLSGYVCPCTCLCVCVCVCVGGGGGGGGGGGRGGYEKNSSNYHAMLSKYFQSVQPYMGCRSCWYEKSYLLAFDIDI